MNKQKTVALILAILLPGIDRMYVGKWGTGILKILTLCGFGVWYIYDIYLVASGKMLDKKGDILV